MCTVGYHKMGFQNRCLYVIKLYYNASIIYGKDQLQCNVHMRPRCILHMFQTRPTYVSDASRTCSKCVLHLVKKGVALMYILQLHHEALCLHGRISHTSQTRPAHISDTFQTRANVTLELSCTVGASSVCSHSPILFIPFKNYGKSSILMVIANL